MIEAQTSPGWKALPCGVHESTRALESCSACARARAGVLGDLAAIAGKRGRELAKALEEIGNGIEQEDEMARESRYTAEQKAEAIRRVDAGERPHTVALELGCSRQLVSQWLAERDRASGADLPAAPERREPTIVDEPRVEPARDLRPADVRNEEIAKQVRQGWENIFERHAPPTGPAAHEDVIAFLARLPPMPWAIGDAIRLLAFSVIDGDRDDVLDARQRIDAHLAAGGI